MSVCFYQSNKENFVLNWRIENLHCRPIYSMDFDFENNLLFTAGGDNIVKIIKIE